MKTIRKTVLYVSISALAGVAVLAAISPGGFETWHKIVVALAATALTMVLVYEPDLPTFEDTQGQHMLPVDPYCRPEEELLADFDHYAAEALIAARTAFLLGLKAERSTGSDDPEAVHTALAHAVSDFAESMCVQMDTLITGSTMTDEPIDGIGQAVFYAYEDATQ